MDLKYRPATEADLPQILEMIALDQLGRSREQFELPLPSFYTEAFKKISADGNQQLMVVECDGEIAGTFHLTWIQYLTYKGGLRLLVEAGFVRGVGQTADGAISVRLTWSGCEFLAE